MNAMNKIYIKKEFDRVPSNLVDLVADIPTSILSDCDPVSKTLRSDIRAAVKGARAVGSALTVKLGKNSNFLLHAALSLAKPGDVLVVDSAGAEAAVFGEIMSTVALATGVAGLIVDGYTRDSDRYGEVGFPIFARGHTPCVVGREPTAGSINLPIECGGVTIEAGALIVADDDGVIVIEPQRIPDVAEKARQKLLAEQQRLEGIRNGARAPAWLEGGLKEANIAYL